MTLEDLERMKKNCINCRCVDCTDKEKLILALEKQNEALRPFAKESESWPYCKDDIRLLAKNFEGDVEAIPISVGDLRKAKAAILERGKG